MSSIPDMAGPVEGVCTPEEWLGQQASRYRSLETEWAIRLAEEIDSLAGDVRFTGAATPDVLDERLEVMGRVERALEDMDAIVRRAAR